MHACNLCAGVHAPGSPFLPATARTHTEHDVYIENIEDHWIDRTSVPISHCCRCEKLRLHQRRSSLMPEIAAIYAHKIKIASSITASIFTILRRICTIQ